LKKPVPIIVSNSQIKKCSGENAIIRFPRIMTLAPKGVILKPKTLSAKIPPIKVNDRRLE
jgi:hypothetical protein